MQQNYETFETQKQKKKKKECLQRSQPLSTTPVIIGLFLWLLTWNMVHTFIAVLFRLTYVSSEFPQC